MEINDNTAGEIQLSNLIPFDSQQVVLDEVLVIVDLISPGFNKIPIRSAFSKAAGLYGGTFPGYRACNIEYHDFHHANDTFLAMARLLHGACLENETFSDRQIVLSLISALLHDSGYI